MKTIKQLKLAAAVAAGLALVGCGSDDETSTSELTVNDFVDCSDGRTVNITTDSVDSVADQISTALAFAQSCDTIVLPAGAHDMGTSVFNFSGTSSLGQEGSMVTNLTIQGAGMPETSVDSQDTTALIFDGVSGDGFLITDTMNITLKDFGVFEAGNNAIKLKDTHGIHMQRVSTVWETDFQETNGAYGLYPVETSNVLIEDSYVRGSADAGIYVGQSDNIVVRNSVAYKNVAGIEIENSTNADVYDNHAYENTGGILIFDLPIGNGKYGSGVRVFDNLVEDNNTENFAVVSSNPGGVHIVPPGTGVIVLSTSDVEIYNNTITDHQTTSIAVTSFMMPDQSVASLPNVAATTYGEIHPYANIIMDGWSPLVKGINIRDNEISVANGVNAPEGALIQDIIDGYAAAQGSELGGLVDGNPKLPEILYDGVGELIANVPYDAVNEPGVGLFQKIAIGINQIAGLVFANYLSGTEDSPQSVSTENINRLATYTDSGADRVCASNNGDATTAGVFETTPSADNFNGEEPFSKLEIFEAAYIAYQTAIATEDQQAAATQGAKMQVYHASLTADDTMSCDGFDAYEGEEAVVTINGSVYGCGSDDHTSNASSCAL